MMMRSYLFVPGNDAARLAAAWTRNADALVVDLEDAVPAAAKVEARLAVADWLRDQAAAPGEVWIRVNNHPSLFASDVAAVAQPSLTGVVVPKVADAAEAAEHASAVLSARPEGEPLGYFPMIETARAMVEVNTIAATPGVTRMMIGEYDLAAELRIAATASGIEMLSYRSGLVLACAAAGLAPPVAPVDTDFRNLELFRDTTASLKRLGYAGRAVIHPAQAAVANEVFTPTPEEVEAAGHVLQLFEQALASGSGVTIDDDGKMLDEAAIRSARRVIEMYGGGAD